MWDLIVSVPDHCLSSYMYLVANSLPNYPKLVFDINVMNSFECSQVKC